MRSDPMSNLSGWDSRHARLVIHLHVLIWIRFRRHALSWFNFFFFYLAPVQTCGLPTGISQKTLLTKHIRTKYQDPPSLSQTQTITNMTYQSPAQWSRTKGPLSMEHLLFGAFTWLVACDVALGRCDSQHVGIILKQPSICQGYAFSLKSYLQSALTLKREQERREKKKTGAEAE